MFSHVDPYSYLMILIADIENFSILADDILLF